DYTNVWSYTPNAVGGAWKQFTQTNTLQRRQWVNCLAVRPDDFNTIVMCQYYGYLNISTDHGATWSGLYNWSGSNHQGDWSSAEIPWIKTSTGSVNSLNPYHMQFDPVVRNKLWVAAGLGVFYCTPPDPSTSPPGRARFTWNNHTVGIEQLTT